MDENRKNTIEVEMTEDDWMELLQVCIDLRVTPDTLIECFCWEVIRQQSLGYLKFDVGLGEASVVVP